MRDKIKDILNTVYLKGNESGDGYTPPDWTLFRDAYVSIATEQILAIFEEAIPKEKEIRKYTPVSWLEKEYGYNQAIAEMKAKVKE